ncbi:MAG: transposase, partial [Synechococcaceae cyanobacterium RM1_1_27]|nr:transposase [Synechococcaceae cyanobacterium RM1_1_27]
MENPAGQFVSGDGAFGLHDLVPYLLPIGFLLALALNTEGFKGKSRKAWLWALHNPQAGAWFHFSQGRGAGDIAGQLGGLHGIAQTDGYAVYESLFSDMNKLASAREAAQGSDANTLSIQHAGCWAHARRKFWESSQIEQSSKAGEVIALIQRLYRIETKVRGWAPADIAAARQIEAIPILWQIHALLGRYRDDPIYPAP